MKDAFIIEPFNGVYFAVFFILLASFVFLCLWAGKKSEEQRRRILMLFTLFNLVIYFLYKYALSIDAGYSMILEETGNGVFTWWGELPIQLCNINMLVLPVSIILNNRSLMGFCFYVGPLGALMAVLMPTIGFSGYSILLLRQIGYYYTHWMICFGGIGLCALKLYKPRYKDILPVFMTALGLALAVYLVDVLLVIKDINPHANYFFAMDPAGNPILVFLRRLIPVDFIYTLPCGLLLIAYMYLATACYNLLRVHLKNQIRPLDQ